MASNKEVVREGRLTTKGQGKRLISALTQVEGHARGRHPYVQGVLWVINKTGLAIGLTPFFFIDRLLNQPGINPWAPLRQRL